MASALSPRSLTLDRRSESYRARAARAAANGALAVALALPLIFLAVWASHRGFASPSLAWIEQRGRLATAGPGFSHLQYVYPPLPVLLALILPGGVLGLAIVTCLFSGAMMLILLRRVEIMTAVVVLLPLVCVPAMWYTASELLPQVVALTFLAVALRGYVQFADYGETYGGFITGLALAVSYAADPGALVYAAVMCLTVPLVGAGRYRRDWEAPIGICAVLVFPCVALAASWSFLLWKFTGNWPGNLSYAPNAHVLAFSGGVLASLGHAVLSSLQDVARAILYLCAGLLVAARRRAAGLGLLLPVIALAAALWLGFDYSPVTSYFMFTLLAVSLITHYRLLDDRRLRWLLLAAAIAQVVVAAVLWPPASAGFTAWRHAIFG
jgi:hypothetical protein